MSSSKRVIVKAGMWYMLSNILLKGISFLTTPIFTRVLSKADYGLYSNFNSWIGLLTIPCSLMLVSTFYVAQYDYKDDIDAYTSTMVLMGMISTIIVFSVVEVIYHADINFFSLNNNYILLMFLYLFFSPIIEMFQMWQRIQYKYRLSSILSIVLSISSTVLALILILNTENKLVARIIGQVIPTVIIGLAITIFFFRRSFVFKREYVVFALKYSIPFIPHSLGMTILSTTDRIMITNYTSAEDTALYSIAYNIAMVMSIVYSSIFSAYNPWLAGKLKERDFSATRKMTVPLLAMYMFPLLLMMLIAPEALLILGGKQYIEALPVIIPVMCGCFFQYIYGIYGGIEQLEKKTVQLGAATTCAAVLNVILNAIAIPIWGYVAAAYTTLICYLLLAIVHYLIVWHMKLTKTYYTKDIVISSFLVLTLGLLCNLLYNFIIIRYTLFIIIGIFFCFHC